MTVIQRFEKNTRGRDFVVGDIHGHLNLVEKLLNEVNFNKETDRLFSVGDLVDRGPDSLGCLRLLREPWFAAVMGNHDYFVADHENVDPRIHDMNGGAWWYGCTSAEKGEAIDVCRSLPYAIEIDTDRGKVGIVHAEVPDDDWTVWERFSPENEMMAHFAMWGRSIIKGKSPTFMGVANVDQVYVGHSVVRYGVKDVYNVKYIDTGACYGFYLTAVCIQGDDTDAIYHIYKD